MSIAGVELQQMADDEAANAEAERFRNYQRLMEEQAKASIAARESRQNVASQRLVFEGMKVTSDGGIRAVGYAQSRSFTREEVLTVLKALKADTGVVAGREALDKAVRVFERME